MNELDDRLRAARARLETALNADAPGPSTVANRGRRRRVVAGVGAMLTLFAFVSGIWVLQSGDGDETAVLSGDPIETVTSVDEQAQPSTTTTIQGVDDVEVSAFTLGGGSGARTSPDGRSVLITFTGAAPLVEGNGCTADYGGQVVSEGGDEVRFALEERKPKMDGPTFCRAAGYARSLELELIEPLGGRRLVEEGSGQELPVFDGSKLMTPTWLPEGWETLREGPGFTSAGMGRDWSRTWGHPLDTSNTCPLGRRTSATIVQMPPELLAEFPANGTDSVATYEIHGTEATYWMSTGGVQQRLAWVEGDQGLILLSSPECDGDEPLEVETLLQIARSVE